MAPVQARDIKLGEHVEEHPRDIFASLVSLVSIESVLFNPEPTEPTPLKMTRVQDDVELIL